MTWSTVGCSTRPGQVPGSLHTWEPFLSRNIIVQRPYLFVELYERFDELRQLRYLLDVVGKQVVHGGARHLDRLLQFLVALVHFFFGDTFRVRFHFPSLVIVVQPATVQLFSVMIHFFDVLVYKVLQGVLVIVSIYATNHGSKLQGRIISVAHFCIQPQLGRL